MNLIGTLYKECDKYLSCNFILERDSELVISINVKIPQREIFDFSVYGLEATQSILKHLTPEDFRKMTDQEIYEASQSSDTLSHLVVYLRDKKINEILK